jgi:hypothetical protein
MERMDYTTRCEMLRKAGFTVLEIERLSRLRSSYTEQEIYRRTVAHQYPKHESWFERVIHKILDICQPPAVSEDIFWMHNHFLY